MMENKFLQEIKKNYAKLRTLDQSNSNFYKIITYVNRLV